MPVYLLMIPRFSAFQKTFIYHEHIFNLRNTHSYGIFILLMLRMPIIKFKPS